MQDVFFPWVIALITHYASRWRCPIIAFQHDAVPAAAQKRFWADSVIFHCQVASICLLLSPPFPVPSNSSLFLHFTDFLDCFHFAHLAANPGIKNHIEYARNNRAFLLHFQLSIFSDSYHIFLICSFFLRSFQIFEDDYYQLEFQ